MSASGGTRRSSRRWRPTPASRWPSSSASRSRGRRRCSPRPCTRWPTRATRACCCSAASGPSAPRRAEHPFGYGRDRYFYSFVVALLLFTLGSVFALYEGIHKLAAPGAAHVADRRGRSSWSSRSAWRASRSAPRSTSRAPLKGRLTWWQFIRQSKTPELPVVLLEDFGALIGLVLALLGVGLTVLTGDAVFDALGTIVHRRPARRHRDRPDHRDEEPADRRGRPPAGARARSSTGWRRRRRCSASSTCARSTSARRSSWSPPRSRCGRGLPIEDVARAIDEAEKPASARRCPRPG